jgi:hypothetical protein
MATIVINHVMGVYPIPVIANKVSVQIYLDVNLVRGSNPSMFQSMHWLGNVTLCPDSPIEHKFNGKS